MNEQQLQEQINLTEKAIQTIKQDAKGDYIDSNNIVQELTDLIIKLKKQLWNL